MTPSALAQRYRSALLACVPPALPSGEGGCALAAAVTGADAALSRRLAPHDTAGWRVSVIVPVRPVG